MLQLIVFVSIYYSNKRLRLRRNAKTPYPFFICNQPLDHLNILTAFTSNIMLKSKWEYEQIMLNGEIEEGKTIVDAVLLWTLFTC